MVAEGPPALDGPVDLGDLDMQLEAFLRPLLPLQAGSKAGTHDSAARCDQHDTPFS